MNDEPNWQTQYAEIAQLAGGLAHEIRNPLSTIRLNVELIGEELTDSDDPKDRRLAKRVDRVQGECLKLEAVLNAFLQFARAGKVNAEACDLSELVRQQADFFEAEASSTGIEVRTHLAAGLPPVAVDRVLFEQVFGNIARNAVAAMPDGGLLEVNTRADGGDVLLEVIDTGRGMTAEQQARMFEAFYSHGTKGGSGLGLPTVRKIVEAHGGEIECTSEPGRGTRFRVRLPAAGGA